MLKCVAKLAISLVWKNVKNVVFGSSLGILSFSLLLEFLTVIYLGNPETEGNKKMPTNSVLEICGQKYGKLKCAPNS